MLDAADNIYLAGSYGLGSVVFEGEAGTFSGPVPADNVFLARYNAAGEIQWATFPNTLIDFSTFSSIYANDLALDTDGSMLYVGGTATGLVDFDLDGLYEINTFLYPAFVAGYTTEGNFAGWHWTGGADAVVDHVFSLSPGIFRLMGDFTSSIDFDGAGDAEPINPLPGDTRGYFSADFNFTEPTVPVELTKFTATADGNAALLSWHTASEINNAGFEILHGHAPGNGDSHASGGNDAAHASGASVQAIHESPVPGAGTTNEPQTYTHRIDGLTPGTHTFQLRQIDFDGAFSLSEKISVSIDLTRAYQLTEAYPNPFNPQATFSLSVAQTQEVEVALYDVLGRRVQSIFEGTLEANATRQFVIDGSGLSSGTYLYRVTGLTFSRSTKVLLAK